MSSVEAGQATAEVPVQDGRVELAADGTLELGGLRLAVAPRAAGRAPTEGELRVAEQTSALTRLTLDYGFGPAVSGRTTVDVHPHGAVHAHVRLRAEDDAALEGLELPALHGPTGEVEEVGGTSWAWIEGDGTALAVAVKKLPWSAAWNDVGAHDHRIVGTARLVAGADGLAVAAGDVQLASGRTIEAALALRVLPAGAAGRARGRAEASYDHPDELRYVPE